MSAETSAGKRWQLGFGLRRKSPPSRVPTVYRLSWPRLALTSLLLSLLICRLAPLLSVPEFALMDRWMRWRPARAPHPSIALVGVQKSEIDEFAVQRPSDCSCLTVSRADLARAITRLQVAGARVIGIDLFLQVPCQHGQDTASVHDTALARALRGPAETVLIAGANPAPDKLYFNDPLPVFAGPTSHPRLVASPVLYNPHGVIRGVRLIQLGLPSERDARRVEPLHLVGRNFSPLSLALLSAYEGSPCELPVPLSAWRVRCGDLEMPCWPAERLSLLEARGVARDNANYAMLISWAGPTGTFPAYSLTTVLTADPLALERWFRGKIVILGNMAERKHTPVSGRAVAAQPPLVDQSQEQTMSGTEIHAHALDTMMQRCYVRLVSRPLLVLLAFLLALAAAAAFQAWSEGRALALIGGLLALLFGASAILMRYHIWLPAVTPMCALLASGIASAVWGYARVRHEVEELATEAELRDAVTDTMVHDLKQPLAAIGALTSLLRMRQRGGDVSLEGAELAERILVQVERAIGNIDDMLNASPGRDLTLTPQRFDLLLLAREIAAVQSLRSQEHTVEVRSSREEVWITADFRLLTRVISNLVDNAIKYWPEGGVIVIAVEVDETQVEIRVTDQGLGVSPEQVERIFARFGRAVPSGVNIPGTGLGLFSVHRIVTAHGGTITVESDVGVGSTFVVRLPLVAPGASAAQGGVHSEAI